MRDAFHTQLVEEARADGAALHDLGQRIGVLHGMLANARRADVDDLRQQFALLREDLQVLHEQDMGHTLDQHAHESWRARVRRLATRLDELAREATSKREHQEAAD